MRFGKASRNAAARGRPRWLDAVARVLHATPNGYGAPGGAVGVALAGFAEGLGAARTYAARAG